MMATKTRIGTHSGMMIDHGTTTDIGRIENDATIIDGMIDMMITDERMILEMIIIGIIVTVIIHQEMIEMTGGHTRVIGITMIEEGMMITKDITMIVGRTIEDLKDLDSFNIIRRVKIIPNPNMFDNHNMKRKKLADQRCRTAIRVGKMATMQMSVQ